jgi:hypothetical protein
VSSAREVGVIDVNNFLRYQAAVHSHNAIVSVAPPLSIHLQEQPTKPSHNPADMRSTPTTTAQVTDIVVWVHNDSGVAVRVETPVRLSREVWERLRSYVDILKPPDSE